jgi:hypothetical protein
VWIFFGNSGVTVQTLCDWLEAKQAIYLHPKTSMLRISCTKKGSMARSLCFVVSP